MQVALEMDKKYRKNPLTAGRIVDGLAFVVTADNSRLHTLNVTATHLWRLADAGVSVEEAASDLTRHFSVDKATALNDVQACLDELVERHILVAVES